MLIHPQFDPVALNIGPLKIHWYGLMYVLAYFQAWWLGHEALRQQVAPLNHKEWDDFLFYAFIGVILGGRLGEILFYHPAYYFAHPVEMVKIWQGGMSFHGGFLGVLLAVSFYVHRHAIPWLKLTDFIAPLVPLGLMFGRLGNFINGELWGRLAPENLPWGMVFPQSGTLLPRHPSQIYQMLGEGLCLFLIVWLYARKKRACGKVSAVFLMGYGIFRFIAEYFREPDWGIFGHSYSVSMGQWLSLPMIIIGAFLFFNIHFSKKNVG